VATPSPLLLLLGRAERYFRFLRRPFVLLLRPPPSTAFCCLPLRLFRGQLVLQRLTDARPLSSPAKPPPLVGVVAASMLEGRQEGETSRERARERNTRRQLSDAFSLVIIFTADFWLLIFSNVPPGQVGR
jgi:hypothetical protein